MKAKIQREILACNKIIADKHLEREALVLKMVRNYRDHLNEILNKKVSDLNWMDAAFVDDANKRLCATIM